MQPIDQPRNYLFLYTRLPDYFFQCIRHLLQTSAEGSKAWIVCYQQDKNAPYDIGQSDAITILNRSTFQETMLDGIRPDVIYISGWGDKLYNNIGKKNKSSIPVIMGLDNPWKANIKQRIAIWLSPFFQQKFCSHLWVAGIWQYEYARRLGFSASRIIRGLYCADTSLIRNNGEHKLKRILYTGRLVDYKRPDWLLRAYKEILKENPGLMHWKLTFIGNGPLNKELEQDASDNSQIEFLPFMQPAEIRKYYEEATVFCLPSHFEHWGVVVQEAAAAGLPLLLSDTCGAATEFLVDGWNGYQFRSQDYEDLKQKLLLLMNKEIPELKKMGDASHVLSKRINHDSWAASLKSVLVNYPQHG